MSSGNRRPRSSLRLVPDVARCDPTENARERNCVATNCTYVALKDKTMTSKSNHRRSINVQCTYTCFIVSSSPTSRQNSVRFERYALDCTKTVICNYSYSRRNHFIANWQLFTRAVLVPRLLYRNATLSPSVFPRLSQEESTRYTRCLISLRGVLLLVDRTARLTPNPRGMSTINAATRPYPDGIGFDSAGHARRSSRGTFDGTIIPQCIIR